MHHWDSAWFKENGDRLYDGIALIEKVWRMGRIGTNGCKEKYGTFRDHSILWDGGLFYLIFPGYYYIPTGWKFIYYRGDPILRFITKWTGLYFIGSRIQRFFYNLGVQLACKRYPEVTDELVMDLQWPEYIRPGIFGKVDGIKIRNKYWKTL